MESGQSILYLIHTIFYMEYICLIPRKAIIPPGPTTVQYQVAESKTPRFQDKYPEASALCCCIVYFTAITSP
jgi:hypothetical protein